MRILLTGGAGFIGSHLVERFLSDGHEVIAVDNLCTGRLANLDGMTVAPRFRFIEHDAVQPLEIDGELDWILHFASPASPPKYLDIPIQTLRINRGHLPFAGVGETQGASFFMASTSEVYGDPAVYPQDESYWGNVNPAGPRSVYDESKRNAEAMTTAYAKEFGLDIRIIRIFNTYGPRMDPDDGRVITNLVTHALRRRRLTVYAMERKPAAFSTSTIW
jgi:nucleoside-diphosphate-sugar epimerase